ncbi:MAG: ABC transporter ATP-binding protein [Actinobacteria bacterium]|nr:ABC transporter ATP-binding protein [Actinomycetota bacterium]
MGVDVELDGVSKRYVTGPDQVIVALDDVNLAIEPGAVLGVAGPSGSGKSTLLHVIGAMDGPDTGLVRVGDTIVTELSRRDQAAYRRKIGFVFQRFHLLPALTALDNVAAPLIPYRTEFDKFERARQLLDGVGLADRATSLPSRLSGGEQQRVAIARALINDPGLLLADEPTGNLDSRTGEAVMELLLELRRERGMTMIVATHDPVIAQRCDKIVRLLDGRVTEVLEADEVRWP